MLFKKRVSIEEKIKKLQDLNVMCNTGSYLRKTEYDPMGSEITRYEIRNEHLGIIAIANSPQEAWKEAIRILGV